jgi:hypothetical protein
MKKVIQMFHSGNADWFIRGWKKWADKLIMLEDEKEYNPEITLVAGARFYQPFFKNVMKESNPYIAVNRPFLGSHKTKHRNQWRVSVNSFANFSMKETPNDRWNNINLERHNWKVTEIKNILIAPPVSGVPIFAGIDTHTWAEDLSKKFNDATIKIRYKDQQGKGKGGRYLTLWNDLDWADLVISYSSAITTEAFWYGKKVISLGVCPTWICQSPNLENWNDPTEPENREQWHNHMGWIQFSTEEWESGEAQEMTIFYQGWPPDVPHYNNFIM